MVVTKEHLRYLFIFIAVIAAAGPVYSIFFFAKATLLSVSLIVIFIHSVGGLKKGLWGSYFFYFIFLLFFLRELDGFSFRLVFNGVVIVCSAYALTLLGFEKKHLLFAIFLTLFFLLYRYFFEINPVDGKRQIHPQVFTLVYLVLYTFGRASSWPLFFFVAFSGVRSALFGMAGVVFFVNRPRTGIVLLVFILSAMFLGLMAMIPWLSQYFDADSINWRMIHWGNILNGFTVTDYIYGRGLGFSWRETLSFDNFYTDGSNYIASHSNYIKLISEVGVLGCFLTLILFSFIFKNSNISCKCMIVFYLGYGFFDEGIFHYDMFWLLVLTQKSYFSWVRNDFNSNCQ